MSNNNIPSKEEALLRLDLIRSRGAIQSDIDTIRAFISGAPDAAPAGEPADDTVAEIVHRCRSAKTAAWAAEEVRAILARPAADESTRAPDEPLTLEGAYAEGRADEREAIAQMCDEEVTKMRESGTPALALAGIEALADALRGIDSATGKPAEQKKRCPRCGALWAYYPAESFMSVRSAEWCGWCERAGPDELVAVQKEERRAGELPGVEVFNEWHRKTMREHGGYSSFDAWVAGTIAGARLAAPPSGERPSAPAPEVQGFGRIVGTLAKAPGARIDWPPLPEGKSHG